MVRRVFFSFHYKPDNWRASQVRNIGVIEGNAAVSDNDWETITGRGDEAIRRWINEQMHGRSCAIVLIGNRTAGRKMSTTILRTTSKIGWKRQSGFGDNPEKE